MDFDCNCLLDKFKCHFSSYWVSSSRLISFVHHVLRDAKLDAQEKVLVLTTFCGFIGSCRVSIM